ncbi:N-acetyltransferase [Halobacillus sp. Marseille-Q1614]|uniref:GNAT family N-acetyltransferase n=1 Tax=Halobacillus sp. Marseille-Q1614 TaxID=2709134 RepID=UPI00156FF3D7|nr:GNAT family N-acetyltransferase [Halobacillus sp. Marseille-Q1614]
MVEIKELKTGEEWIEAFPVMKQLRSQHSQESYLNIVGEAQKHEGYKMFALYQGDQIASVIGFMPQTTLYYGRFIWVCDLVTDSNIRSKGYGKVLLSFVHKWAATHGYESVALSSGLQREEAHQFYEEKMDYQKVSK